MRVIRIAVFALGVVALASGVSHLNAYLGISRLTGEPGFGYRWPAVALWGSVLLGLVGVSLMIKARVLWARMSLGVTRVSAREFGGPLARCRGARNHRRSERRQARSRSRRLLP